MADLSLLFKGPLNLSGWTHHNSKDNYVYEGVPIPGLHQEVYRKVEDRQKFSVGIFTFNNRPAYIAWGYTDEEHCSFHALLSEDGVGEARLSCPDVMPLKTPEGAVTGFVLDGTEEFKA